ACAIASAAMGCAAPGSIPTAAVAAPPAQLAAAPVKKDPVQSPYPKGWRAAVAAYVKTYWRDPPSIRNAAVAAPVVEIFDEDLPKPDVGRWVVCLRMNSKNAFGGYTGLTLYQVIMVGDQVFKVWADSDWGKSCDGVKLAPFPEINGSGT